METLPMLLSNISLIQQGKKSTTLRSLKYDYQVGQTLRLEGTDTYVEIQEKRQIPIPDGLTREIAGGEGYKDTAELTQALKAGYRLPSVMWLYKFKVVKPPAAKPEASKRR